MNINMILRNTCFLVAAITLVGCAGKSQNFIREPYKHEDKTPFAELSYEVKAELQQNEKIQITMPLDSCEKRKADKELQVSNVRMGVLFDQQKGKVVEPGPTHRVPAGKPIILMYSQHGGPRGAYCHVEVTVNLQAGKKYSLIGGQAYVKSRMALTDGAGCGLGVIDKETRQLVPEAQLCPADFATSK